MSSSINAFSVTSDIAFGFADFSSNNQSLAMKKDGQRSLFVLLYSVTRFELLATQLTNYIPSIERFKIGYWIFPISIGTVILPAVSDYCNAYVNKMSTKASSLVEKTRLSAAKAVLQFSDAVKVVGQQSNIIMNVACAVSYVALITLGFPVSGTIGLSFLVLTALKQNLFLPEMLVKYLEDISVIASLGIFLAQPMNLAFRAWILFLGCLHLDNIVSNNPKLAAYLPKWMKELKFGSHETTPEKVIETLKKVYHEDKDLNLDPKYVYSEHLDHILPPDNFEKLTYEKKLQLIKELDQKIKQQQVVLTPNAITGLEKIKICLLQGRVEDQSPANFELFQQYVCFFIRSIVDNELNFESEVKALAEVGNSCVEGWTRDITGLLYPQTKDVKWSVHHELAKWRSNVIKETVLDVAQVSDNHFESNGGTNNIHVLNVLQSALNHRFRSYEGIVTDQIHGNKSFFDNLLVKGLLRGVDNAAVNEVDNRLKVTTGEIVYLSLILNNVLGAGNVIFTYMKGFLSTINSKTFDIENTINVIYDAIKPEYRPSSDGKVDVFRKISWNAVTTWQADFNQRIGETDLDIDISDAKWIETDLQGNSYLSKEGVILLLIDMGILV